MEDIEIIELYQNRSEKAIAESDKKYGAYCFTVANNILANKEDSGECVNDTWLHTWNIIPPQYPERLKMFFAKITRNLSINRLKSKNTQKRGSGELALAIDELEECVPDNSSVENIIDEKLLTECIRTFLKKIPQRDRQLFLLRYFYTESVTNIASRYKLSENTVSVSLYRTRKKLKDHLEKEGFSV